MTGVNRILSIGLLLVAMLLAVNAMAGHKREIEKRFDVSSGGRLVLETDLGEIEVRTAAENQAFVRVVLNAKTADADRANEIFDRFNVDFEQDEDEIFVTAEFDGEVGGWRFWDNRRQPEVIFYITVPREFDLDLETSGGNISLDDLEGDARVSTSGGSLDFGRLDGHIDGHTSGGSIRVAECSGTVDVTTSGGSIQIGQVKGDLQAHTSGGSILVDEVMGTINASTSGGSIEASLTRQPEQECRLTTSAGAVTVYLSSDIAVNIDAETSGGEIYSDFATSRNRGYGESTLRERLNGGGPRLYLRTSAGNISIEKK